MKTAPAPDPKQADPKLDYLTKIKWPTADPWLIESRMVKGKGYIEIAGKRFGNGMFYHFKKAMTALWPNFEWHIWSDLLIQNFCENAEIGVMGPASSGKTFCAAAWALCYIFCWPKDTSVIMSSTTRSGLQLRVWGAVKELYTRAKSRRPWLPGRIMESAFMLTMNDVDEEAKDFRDGIIGVACKVGSTFVGLSNYVGLKNDRIVLIADEASLMGRGFIDSVANLRKGGEFKLIAMGNPKDRTDALGVVCEPSSDTGGWDGLDYVEKTRTWKTRAHKGVAVQLCGYDTPNGKYPKGLNPYSGLITPEHIEADLAYYGKDSLQFSMMNLGCMPKDGGNRRVVTVSLCESNLAFEEVYWGHDSLTRIIGLDAAYSGVGGDRCVLTELVFGVDTEGKHLMAFAGPQVIVPVTSSRAQIAEEQIAEYVKNYCEKRNILPDNAGFDSTGRGTLMSAFARLWSPNVVPIEFGGKPSDRLVRDGDAKTERESYGKMVTALWYSSRLIIESKQLRALPRECAEEGACREWGINRDGKVDVEPKDKTKERMGRSPDLWDSFVVAIEMARRRGFQIAPANGVVVKRRSVPDWLKSMQNKTNTLRKTHSLTYQ